MKEPIKYRSGPDGGLQLTKEWKDWRNKVLSDGATKHFNNSKTKDKPKTIGRSTPISPEDHKPHWKPVAQFANSEKQIYFCACQSGTGNPYSGCGAVAIQRTRSGALEVVVEPRFE